MSANGVIDQGVRENEQYYVEDTVQVVFLVFVTCILLSLFSLILMCYARYRSRRTVPPGFYRPVPKILRRFHKPSRSHMSKNSDYGYIHKRPSAPSAMSSATAQSDVL
eukprot:TRINITY_DN2276_c0_g1_i1.p1 TRINITY_DN2276_c0_g1~~TRINITY_DN2276_c0_g1_i1.p1  ORF type:complete len:108 (-),score=9.41 TRINITY_DN2276_c0_g1_i1:155-478(-)